ncbi:hypothetical protein [Ornithinibacillus scapharcae]|uniref:hypothetical protein n=1 Tax=Ornithinibacillus scapharcae TaxID=1147159 RepID=UPI000225AA75|nr:hypothetical protein [Ornithinibacillus scapharcae]
MLKRFLTAIVSSIVFSGLMGLLNYMTTSTSSFDSFWLPMLFFLMYSTPVYLIGGIPISYLIDKLIEKKNFSSPVTRHYTRYGFYLLAGIIVAVIYIIILAISNGGFESISQLWLMYLVGGVIASLVFYYVSLIFQKKPIDER